MGTEASGCAAVSCSLLACYRHVLRDCSCGSREEVEEDMRPCRETADRKTEEDPPCLDRAGSKMSQTSQWGCHQPLPTDWSSLSHPCLQCCHPHQPLAAQAGLQAGPCGSLKFPKSLNRSIPAWCTVPWAWLAGVLHSGLPVRNSDRFRFTGAPWCGLLPRAHLHARERVVKQTRMWCLALGAAVQVALPFLGQVLQA